MGTRTYTVQTDGAEELAVYFQALERAMTTASQDAGANDLDPQGDEPKARRRLAKKLRELAGVLDAGET